MTSAIAEVRPRRASFSTDDAEEAVLGAMLMDRAAIVTARAILHESSFADDANRRVFRAMRKIFDDGGAVDPITLEAQIEQQGDLEAIGGREKLAYLVDVVPTAANVEYHAELVRAAAFRRSAIEINRRSTSELEGNGISTAEVLRWQQEALGEVARHYGPVSERRIGLTDDEALMDSEDPPWLIEGRIPRGGTVQIFGGSGTFKSFVVVDLACHIAVGMDWHGKRVAQGNVVYICAEGVHGMKHRITAWKNYNGVEGKLGLYFLRHGIGLKAGSKDVPELLAEIASRVSPPPVLIVVDTLARNFIGNENDAADMNAYVKGCDQLREATGATVLSVHHTGWADAERARGSSSNRAAMDTDIVCTRDGDRVTLKNTKQKDAAEFSEISFEALPIGKSLVLKPMDQSGGKLDGNRLRCLRALDGMQDGATHGQWRKKAELTNKNSSFNAARNWLVESGYVRKAADKKYVVTDAGRMALGPQSIRGLQLVHDSKLSDGLSGGGLLDPALDQEPTLLFPLEAAWPPQR